MLMVWNQEGEWRGVGVGGDVCLFPRARRGGAVRWCGGGAVVWWCDAVRAISPDPVPIPRPDPSFPSSTYHYDKKRHDTLSDMTL